MTIPSCPFNAYGGWSSGLYSEATLRAWYDQWFAVFLKPPAEQFRLHYEATSGTLRAAGYSEQEIKWWFLRTGQGPKCFEQYTVGPGNLPPYDVWAAWYFCNDTQWGLGIRPTNPIYPPPGYRMPNCGTMIGDGRRFNWTGWQYGQALPCGYNFDLYAPIYGYGYGSSLSLFAAAAQDAFPSQAGGAFCYDETQGKLHAVPLAFTVFDVNYVRDNKAFVGLPIAMMRRLDQLTNGEWWRYMDDRIDYYLHNVVPGVPYSNARAWPLAIKDTLAHFGLNEPAIASLAQKMDEGVIQTYEAINRRPKFVNMMGDDMLAQVVTMVCIAGIAMIASAAIGAAIGAIAEAASAAEASAVATSTGVEVGIEGSLVSQGITGADVMNVLKAAKTVYGLVEQIQSDNPNLLGIAGGVLSLSNTLGISDLASDWFDTFGVSATDVAYPGNLESFLDPGYGYDLGMAAQVGAISPDEASFLLGNISTDVLSTVAPDAMWDYAGFADVAWGDMSEYGNSIAQGLLSGEISSPDELFASIQGAADSTAANLTDAMDVALEDYNFSELQDVTGGILADDLSMAAVTDFGDLSTASFDFDMADTGWTDNLSFENALDSAESVISDVVDSLSSISLEDAIKYAQLAQNLYSVVTADNTVKALPKPAGTPTPAQIVSPAPAPTPVTVPPVVAPSPIPADVTTAADYVADTAEDYYPVEASVAPGEVLASNWGWLWALAGIAIVLPERKEKRRRRKARR